MRWWGWLLVALGVLTVATWVLDVVVIRMRRNLDTQFAAIMRANRQRKRQAATLARPSRIQLMTAYARDGAPGDLDVDLTFDAEGLLVTYAAERNQAPNRTATLTINGERTTWTAEFCKLGLVK